MEKVQGGESGQVKASVRGCSGGGWATASRSEGMKAWEREWA